MKSKIPMLAIYGFFFINLEELSHSSELQLSCSLFGTSFVKCQDNFTKGEPLFWLHRQHDHDHNHDDLVNITVSTEIVQFIAFGI